MGYKNHEGIQSNGPSCLVTFALIYMFRRRNTCSFVACSLKSCLVLVHIQLAACLSTVVVVVVVSRCLHLDITTCLRDQPSDIGRLVFGRIEYIKDITTWSRDARTYHQPPTQTTGTWRSLLRSNKLRNRVKEIWILEGLESPALPCPALLQLASL